MNIAELTRMISVVCPIAGINSAGIICFKDEATQAQRVTAQLLMTENLPSLTSELGFSELKALELSSFIELREKMCARIAGIGQRLARGGDLIGATSCDDVVNALLDMLLHPSITSATDISGLKLALKTRYNAAVNLASVSAKTEFVRYVK